MGKKNFSLSEVIYWNFFLNFLNISEDRLKWLSLWYIYQISPQDLQACIEQDFPVGSELTPLEREREAHQAFADVRCQVYIGRQEYFTQIDEKLEAGIGEPMVLLGESGIYIMSRKLILGKSGIHIVIL